MLLPRRSTALVRVALPRMAVCPGALLASAVWRFCTAERSVREVVGARSERLKHQKDECQNLFCPTYHFSPQRQELRRRVKLSRGS